MVDNTNLGYEAIARRLLARDFDTVQYEQNLAFYHGDHLRADLSGWNGSILPTTDSGYNEMVNAIKKAFVSKNMVQAVVETHLAAILGRSLSWSIGLKRELTEGEVPTDEEQQLINEVKLAAGEWWNVNKLNRALKQAGVNLLLGNRGVLRLLIRQSKLENGMLKLTDSLSKALEFLVIDTPPPTSATVGRYPSRYGDEIGVYQYIDDETGQRGLEVTWVDPTTNMTMWRVNEQTVQFDLNRRLPFFQLDLATPFINPQIIQLQKLINRCLTMANKNIDLGVFVWFIINANLPGKITRDPDTGEEVKEVTPLKSAPGSFTLLMGAPTFDEQGNPTGYSTPGVQRFEPVQVDVYKQTESWATDAILSSANQLYFKLSGEIVAGDSRKQAMHSFLESLEMTIAEYNLAVKWIFDVMLRFGGLIQGQPDRYAGLEVTVQITPDTGPITDGLITAYSNLQAQGQLSLHSLLQKLGFTDDEILAELNRIQEELQQKTEREQAAMASSIINSINQADQNQPQIETDTDTEGEL